WPGLLAALFFVASPLECDYASRSLRDVSPLWFAALGFFGLVCLVGRFRAPAGNLAAAGGTGILAALGCGWRPEALFPVPFLGLPVLVCVRCSGWRWRGVGLNAAAFLLGAALTHVGLNVLCREPRQATLVGFHMAYYGEHARCNVLGLENSCQIHRDDIQT